MTIGYSATAMPKWWSYVTLSLTTTLLSNGNSQLPSITEDYLYKIFDKMPHDTLFGNYVWVEIVGQVGIWLAQKLDSKSAHQWLFMKLKKLTNATELNPTPLVFG